MKSWNINPINSLLILARSDDFFLYGLKLSILTSPLSGFIKQPKIINSVVLPQPLGPDIDKNSPLNRSIEALFKTTTLLLLPYDLLIFFAVTKGLIFLTKLDSLIIP